MKRIILSLLATVLFATNAAAHHSWSAIYDTSGDVEIEGVISKVVWRNPHVVIEFTVDEGTPNEKVWVTESNSVAALTRMDVTKDLISVGTRVRAAGYPHKELDDDFFMNHMLLMGEGREIVFLRTAEPRWPDATRIGDVNIAHGLNEQEDISERPESIFAVWTTIFGAEGSHRALKAPGPDFRIAYAEPRGLGACMSKDVWDEMGSPYPVGLIDNKDGTITIHAEQNDTIRTVYMDVEHNDTGAVKNNLGYSTGHFVGDTLVVFTTFAGSNSALQMHETFTLSGDRNHLNYTQTLVNPDSNDLPTISAKWWEFQPGVTLQPYDCVDATQL